MIGLEELFAKKCKYEADLIVAKAQVERCEAYIKVVDDFIADEQAKACDNDCETEETSETVIIDETV